MSREPKNDKFFRENDTSIKQNCPLITYSSEGREKKDLKIWNQRYNGHHGHSSYLDGALLQNFNLLTLNHWLLKAGVYYCLQ